MADELEQDVWTIKNCRTCPFKAVKDVDVWDDGAVNVELTPTAYRCRYSRIDIPAPIPETPPEGCRLLAHTVVVQLREEEPRG